MIEMNWIPSSERLPKKSGIYLITTKKGEVATARYYADADYETDYIIAWMPLPEPYKGGTRWADL